MLGALTTDVLVHTWDLARAIDADPALDAGLCDSAYAAARGAHFARGEGTIGPEVAVSDDADAVTKLIAFYGRDPSWTPPRPS